MFKKNCITTGNSYNCSLGGIVDQPFWELKGNVRPELESVYQELPRTNQPVSLATTVMCPPIPDPGTHWKFFLPETEPLLSGSKFCLQIRIFQNQCHSSIGSLKSRVAAIYKDISQYLMLP